MKVDLVIERKNRNNFNNVKIIQTFESLQIPIYNKFATKLKKNVEKFFFSLDKLYVYNKNNKTTTIYKSNKTEDKLKEKIAKSEMKNFLFE